MVDVHEKPDTYRAASATGTIQVSPEVFAAVRDHTAKKGDVLGVARLAGDHGAKKNAELIPLCHIVPLTNCEVTIYHGREYKFYYGRVHHIMWSERPAWRWRR